MKSVTGTTPAEQKLTKAMSDNYINNERVLG